MQDSRMGKRKKIRGAAEFIYSGKKTFELEADDISVNAIGVLIPLDHHVIDDIRTYFSQVATIKHPRLPESVPGVLHRVEKVSGNKLKMLFSFNRKIRKLK